MKNKLNWYQEDIRASLLFSSHDSHSSHKWQQTWFRLSFLMLYLHNKVFRWVSLRVSGTESGRSRSLEGGRRKAADSVQFLVRLWPKRGSSQHLSQCSNHRLTAAITELVANQSAQTSLHACAYKPASAQILRHTHTHTHMKWWWRLTSDFQKSNCCFIWWLEYIHLKGNTAWNCSNLKTMHIIFE